MGSFAKRLFSTISEQDFNQNIEEVAYSIYLAAYWHIAQNVGTWLGIKDEIYIYPYFLHCLDNGDQQIQMISFPWLLHFVLVLYALVRKSSDLLEFNQTLNAAMFSSKREIFDLQIHHIYAKGVGLIPLELHILQKRFCLCKKYELFSHTFSLLIGWVIEIPRN